MVAATGPVRLERAGETVLLLEDGHCFREQKPRFYGNKLGAESDVRAMSLSTLAQMVEGGAGTTLLPRLALAIENRREQLLIRRLATRRSAP